jgi:protein required for attachment to host cells
MLKKTWMLITDVSSARIYAMHHAKFLAEPTAKNLEFIGDYSHEQSREANHDLVTDKPGLFGSKFYGTSAFDPKTEPKVHEAEVFATALARSLDLARGENKFKDLIIVASPAFMGMLNKHMSTDLQRMITQRIEKDYTHLNENELVKMLSSHF